MYRVLIVDDEVVIRRGLSRIIPWEETGFELAGAVGDARKALEILENTRVNVVLTDIRMPDISGLELIGRAKKLQPGIKTVVISGYSEFDYAVEAIKLKVENYILKPLDPHKITEIFETLKKVLDEEQKNKQKDMYIQAEYEMLRGVYHEDKGCREEYQAKLIRLLEEGRYTELDAFADELFDFLERGEADVREYCLKALRNAALYFHLENPPLFASYRLDSGSEEYKREGRNCLKEDLRLLAAQLKTGGEPTELLVSSQARQYIDLNYRNKNLSLREVADQLGVSYGYLSAAFARTYNKTFKAYLTSLRIERARKLLLERTYKIYEIADMTGYSSSRYFTEAFKKYYGLSPVDYLRRLGGEAERECHE
ncbi:MAG: response regulator [Hungatella sp.]|nr:response regulator [Hungatella sp.]